jgi:hypothetical protein
MFTKWLVLVKRSYLDEFAPRAWFDFRSDAESFVRKQHKNEDKDVYRVGQCQFDGDKSYLLPTSESPEIRPWSDPSPDHWAIDDPVTDDEIPSKAQP